MMNGNEGGIRVHRVLVFAGGALAFVSSAGMARAATIPVNTQTMEYVKDSKCGLSEAIVAVNTKAAFDGCPKGTGNDVITVPAGNYHAASDVNMNISATVTIQGPGISPVNVSTSSGTVSAGPTAHIYGATNLLFWVEEGGSSAITVTFQNLYLDGGLSTNGGIQGYSVHGSTINLEETYVYGFQNSGVYVDGLNLGVTNSLFDFNSAVTSGGGIYFSPNSHNLTITNAAFTNNTAAQYGGGIEYYGLGTSTLTGLTFGNNTAGYGGGALDLEAYQGTLTLSGSTIANNGCNVSNCSGAGVLAYGYDSGVTQSMNGCIVADNLDDDPNYSDVYGDGSLGVSNSFIYRQNGEDLEFTNNGNVNTTSDPQLNYGDVTANYYGGNYLLPVVVLEPTSPAIDYISSFTPTTDERGFPRGIKGGTGRSTLFDVGSMEYDPHSFQAETITAVSTTEATTVVHNSAYSNGEGLELPATKVGDNVAFLLPIIEDPNLGYDMVVNYATGPNEGIIQLEWSQDNTFKTGVTPIGPAIDLYASSAGFDLIDYYKKYGSSALANFDPDVPTYIRFRVTGRNSKNTTKNPTEYYLYLDYIQPVWM